MTLPNILTVVRIFLTVLFVYLMNLSGIFFKLTATGVFTLASLTDYWDGHYARKHACVSNFGKLMDPIADKFLILTAFFVFARMGLIAPWMFGVIFLREVVVTALRLVAVQRRKILAAETAGKYKTIFQIIAISVILIFILLNESSLILKWPAQVRSGYEAGIYLLMLVVVFLTLFSGAVFLLNNRKEIFLLKTDQPYAR